MLEARLRRDGAGRALPGVPPDGILEEILTYPHEAVRLVDGVASYLHGDQLGSVRTVTDAAGGLAKRSTYRPFGDLEPVGLDEQGELGVKVAGVEVEAGSGKGPGDLYPCRKRPASAS